MTTTTFQRPLNASARTGRSLRSVAKELLRNVAALLDVALHARSVSADVRRMQALLQEADRCERSAPARAAELRAASRTIVL